MRKRKFFCCVLLVFSLVVSISSASAETKDFDNPPLAFETTGADNFDNPPLAFRIGQPPVAVVTSTSKDFDNPPLAFEVMAAAPKSQ